MSIPAVGHEGTAAEAALLTAEAYEQGLLDDHHLAFELVLYVAGTAPRSLRAIANTRRLCDQHLSGRYDLQVVDIYQQPALAEQDGILAVPVLVKKKPLPVMQFVGDLSDLRRVIDGLGLPRSAAGGDGP